MSLIRGSASLEPMMQSICGRTPWRNWRTVHINRTVMLCGLLVCAVIAWSCSLRAPFVSDQLSSAVVEPANDDEVIQTIFLIGDAGKPSPERREPTLAALTKLASQSPDKSLILFLGDNIYQRGMPEKSDPGRSEAERKLNEQVSVAEESGARSIFIPGNHDWGSGWEGIIRQEEFLRSKENSNVMLLPHGGCPGPEVIDTGNQLRLVILDTQWWLEEGLNSQHPNWDCCPDSKEEVIDSLARALRDAGDRYVLVVGHHPLDSHGRHGGFFDWNDHLFPLRTIKSWMWLPLPGIGSIYPVARMLGIVNQDISSGAYGDMKARIEAVLSQHPPLAYVGGHEHTLEVLRGSGPYLIVISGAGCSDHRPTLTSGSNTIFAYLHPGFVRIDILRDDSVRLSTIVPIDGHGGSKEIFSMWVVARE